ncbi:hypothetical protein [Rheinheimera mangrovi]|jgi:hypothetical protein|uniref:hypothetical protein n=1 Tax=Rheinheimera mangrovi TaxID=2498451 RepID=UPI000F8E2982|nr:hypothetical protein [Rheinheimera mangrovi]
MRTGSNEIGLIIGEENGADYGVWEIKLKGITTLSENNALIVISVTLAVIAGRVEAFLCSESRRWHSLFIEEPLLFLVFLTRTPAVDAGYPL